MGWAKVDDQFYDHPKVQLVGNAGAGLYVKSLAYCCRHLTDGIVPKPWTEKEAAGDDGLVQRLLTARLWELVEGLDAYRIPDFLDFNPSREEVLSRRDSERTRKQRERESDRDTPVTPGTGTGRGSGTGPGTETAVAREPRTVDRKPVTDAEHETADAVLRAFNETAGTSLSAAGHRRQIIGRLREHPELELADHRRVIVANFAHPWWSGRPGVGVIYGSDAQFERAMEQAKTPGQRPASRRDAAQERIEQSLREAAA